MGQTRRLYYVACSSEVTDYFLQEATFEAPHWQVGAYRRLERLENFSMFLLPGAEMYASLVPSYGWTAVGSSPHRHPLNQKKTLGPCQRASR